METIEITNNAEFAYQKILDSILSFKFKPDETITEVDLSEKLGLSRTPVREAISRLENEGLIITQNRTKKIHILSPVDIEEIFDLKIAIESLVARQASEKGSAKQMNALGNVMLEIRRLREKKLKREVEGEAFFEEWLQIDERFHLLLFEMSNNNRAQQIVQMLNKQWHRFKVGLSVIESRTEKTAVDHEAMGKAILQREPEAAERAVLNHLENLKFMLLKLMKTFKY